jgi:lipopolysaccharide heptosyltransferase II
MPPSSNPVAAPRYRFVRMRWHLLFAVVDAIGTLVARLLSKFRKASNEPQRPHEVRRVLLVQLDHLGDAVLTTSLLPGLRERFPQATIDVFCAPWNCEVFVRREVGRIFVSRWNRFQRRFAWLWPCSTIYWGWKLRTRKYDIAVDVRGEFSVALLMTLCGAKRRVGWPCAGGGFLLTDRVEYVPHRHEVESRHAMLRTLGYEKRGITPPSFTPSPDADRFVVHMLGEFLRDDRPLLVFHIGAGTPAKTWPVEHWRELLGRASLEFDARVILVGGTADVETARTITQDQFWPGLMDWTGRLTIDQLAALLRRADVVIGNDSGPAHLAAAVETETVVLFSGTNDPALWRPWGERVQVLRNAVTCSPCYRTKCPLADHPCLRGLTPETVIDALHSILDGPAILPLPQLAGRRVGRTGDTP